MAGNPLKLINFDAPTLEKYSQANPRTFICRHFFDLHPPVVRPVSNHPISPTIASGNFRTLTIRSATPYYIDIFCKRFKLNSRESSYRIFRSKPSPNAQFQGRVDFEYFIKLSYYFLRIRHLCLKT